MSIIFIAFAGLFLIGDVSSAAWLLSELIAYFNLFIGELKMEISETFKWIVVTGIAFIGMILANLGMGKLRELRTARQFQIQDKNNEIHETNQTAQIEFNKVAFETFYDEFKELKKEVKEIRDKLSSQMERNARLETENKHLKETKENQEKEISELPKDREILQGQVSSLTNIGTRLQAELDSWKKAKTA